MNKSLSKTSNPEVLKHMKKPKKILIVLYYYHPYVSGLSVYAKRLTEGLVKSGSAVTVLTTKHESQLKAEGRLNGVNIIRCPIIARLSKGVLSPVFLYQAIKLSKSYDIVNFHLPLAEAGIASLFINRDKLITTYHCDINLGRGLINKLIEKLSFYLMRIILKRSRKIITQSKGYFAASKMSRFADKAVAIIPPIDTKQFSKKNGLLLRKKLGIGKDDFVIGFVGRIVFEKGIKYLLGAIKYLPKKIRRFKVVIVGDYKKVAGGSIKEQLNIFLKKYPGKIIFTGYLSDKDLLKFYSTINVLVLPSIDPLEAFGMVQVEAMCCGCPVIASNLPGVNTVVSKTKFGYLVKPRSSKEIAEKIILVNQKKYSNRGFRKKDWDIKATLDLYLEVFERVK